MDCWFPLAPPCRSILSFGWGELSQSLYACKVCQPASHIRLHCDYEPLAGDASPFFNPPKLLAGVTKKTTTVVINALKNLVKGKKTCVRLICLLQQMLHNAQKENKVQGGQQLGVLSGEHAR